MIGDKAMEVKVDVNIKVKGHYAGATIRLDEKPLDSSLTAKTDPAPTLRNLRMRIAYRPRNDRPKYQGRPYVVVCSETLKNYDSRFRDWADFCHRAESDPMLAFVKKWTQLSEELFEMAKTNSGIDFYFGVDWLRYRAYLAEKFEAQYGRKPTAADRMFSYEIEGLASVESTNEYSTTLYENNIRRGGGGNA